MLNNQLPDHVRESHDRLVRALRERSMTTEEAAAAMLGVERVPAAIAPAVLEIVVRDDRRIRQDEAGRWSYHETANALAEVDFVVLDVETTGMQPPADRITELGAIRVRNGRIVDEFNELINPEREIPWGVVRLTGITNDMVKNKPTALQVFPRFADWLRDSIVVAHNAPFDRFFIDTHWQEVFGAPTANTWLCSVRLSRKLYPGLKSRSLGPLCQALGIPIERLHRAGDDARLTAHVLIRALDDLAGHGVNDLDALFALVSPTVLGPKRRKNYRGIDPAEEPASQEVAGDDC